MNLRLHLMRQIIILLLLLITSCSVKIQYGNYESLNNEYFLSLSKDNTFHYNQHYEYIIYRKSSGQWNLGPGHNLILNSYLQDNFLPLKGREYLEKNASINHQLIFEVHDIPKNQRNCYECMIFINNNLFRAVNCEFNSMINIPKDVKNIYIGIHSYPNMPGRFLDTVYTKPFSPDFTKYNLVKLEVTFVDSFFNYTVFDSKKLHIKRNSLRFYNERNDGVIVLRKTNKNNYTSP